MKKFVLFIASIVISITLLGFSLLALSPKLEDLRADDQL